MISIRRNVKTFDDVRRALSDLASKAAYWHKLDPSTYVARTKLGELNEGITTTKDLSDTVKRGQTIRATTNDGKLYYGQVAVVNADSIEVFGISLDYHVNVLGLAILT